MAQADQAHLLGLVECCVTTQEKSSMISVIITAHNEGTDLEITATLAAYGSLRPHEVIVVDDCSEPRWEVGERLDHIERCRVIKTPHQLGVAASRNFGAARATGDVIVFLDSHMRMPDWWLEKIQEAVEQYPSSIFCTACTAWNYLNGSTFYAGGAEFGKDKVGLEPVWLVPEFQGPTDICPCLLGACYVFPTPIWRALQGFNPNFVGWGQDEQDVSYRAWAFGYEVRRIQNLVIQHRWDRNPLKDEDPKLPETWQKCMAEDERFERLPEGDFMNVWHPGYNSVVNCATVFEAGVFEAYKPKLKEKYPDSRVWRLFSENMAAIRKTRNWVQDRRIRTDKEIETIIGYCIPTVNQEE